MKEIEDKVQQYILGQKSVFDKLDFDVTSKESIKLYKAKTAMRLAKNWVKYVENQISITDLLCSLRNYLLLFQTSVILPDNMDINLNENKFGLRIDSDNKVYAVIDGPAYMNEKIIEQAFIRNFSGNIQESNYFLGTNPFIFNLTSFNKFKTIEQKIAVNGAMNTPDGYTTLVSLPTGGGKSLITQAMAYQKKRGLTIVVVPTVSLAMDQVRAAKKNIKQDTKNEVFGYYSGIDEGLVVEIITGIKNETARLLFLSPEALIKNTRIKNAIDEANTNRYLKNIIIDEAHIVIEWGTFFRVDYQCLEAWRNNLLINNSALRTILLSATFEKKTVQNLKQMFSDNDKWIEVRCDSLRKEPRFSLVQAKSFSDKKRKILELIRLLPRPMIVYVTSPDKAERIKNEIINIGFSNVETFTGKTKTKDRERIIKEWASDEYDIIIATSAFGVGVDKNDVRTVLHLYIPENPNKYYQELGRGGRDGLPCLSVMCIEKEEDLSSAFNMTDKVLTTDKIIGRWFSMLNSKTSKRYADIITLDTAVKPNYNNYGDEYYDKDGSKGDVQWNMYVILLLRRYDLIGITNMTFDASTKYYYLSIKIKEDTLRYDNAETLKLIDEIRENEAKKFRSDFKIIQNSIKESEKICWSEMFYESYGLVSEFCAGCNQHINVIHEEKNRFPLVKKVDNPTKKITSSIERFFSGTNEMMISSENDNFEIISKIVDRGIDNIVLGDESKEKHLDLILNLSQDCQVNIMGYKEYEALLQKSNMYFLSGSTLIIHCTNSEVMYKLIKVAKKAIKLDKTKIIHMVPEDVYIQQFEKTVSELIDGPHLEAYIIEKMEV